MQIIRRFWTKNGIVPAPDNMPNTNVNSFFSMKIMLCDFHFHNSFL